VLLQSETYFRELARNFAELFETETDKSVKRVLTLEVNFRSAYSQTYRFIFLSVVKDAVNWE